jgi:hypothetical protein
MTSDSHSPETVRAGGGSQQPKIKTRMEHGERWQESPGEAQDDRGKCKKLPEASGAYEPASGTVRLPRRGGVSELELSSVR